MQYGLAPIIDDIIENEDTVDSKLQVIPSNSLLRGRYQNVGCWNRDHTVL